MTKTEIFILLSFLSVFIATNPTCSHSHCEVPLHFLGPETYYQDDDPLKISSAGAINMATRVGGHWIVGSVNGGLWMSDLVVHEGGQVLSPRWRSVGDGEVNCFSIVVVSVSERNPEVVYAGCGGSTSSEQGVDWNVLNDGDWGGIMVSRNGGERWEMVSEFPVNYFVTDILELLDGTVLVSTRSSYFNASDGGIWRREPRESEFKKVYHVPVFNMRYIQELDAVIASTVMETQNALISRDRGTTWQVESNGISWEGGRIPFYSTLAVSADGSVAFLGSLTVNPEEATDTFSDTFWTDLTTGSSLTWKKVANQPQNLDQDMMPKDRMGLLVDPNDKKILYVAGNAGSVAYRVDWMNGNWVSMIGNDTVDNSAPHVDCRNYAWNEKRQSLILVTDGGIFERLNPSQPGGRWRSLNGNIREMEFLSARWDIKLKRWAAGAQDNCVQLSPPDTRPGHMESTCMVMGDGTLTAVDNTQNPPRLFGCVQFLGTSDDDKKRGIKDEDYGMAFVQGTDLYVGIPLPDFGFDEQRFRYFIQPFSLNVIRPTDLVFFAEAKGQEPSGWYVIDLPPGLNHTDDIKPPTLLQSSQRGGVFTFVAGGYRNNQADPNVLVGMNGTHYYYKDSSTGLLIRKLPTVYADPIVFPVDSKGEPVVGPVSHGKTVSLAVHPDNSLVALVTGWPSVLTNEGKESIYLTPNGGETWIEVMGNLAEVTGTIGKVRPSGLIFIPIPSQEDTAVLVGTTRGIYINWLSNLSTNTGSWKRLGSCHNFPIVVVMDISYVPEDDSLIIATFGRGIFMLTNLSHHLSSC